MKKKSLFWGSALSILLLTVAGLLLFSQYNEWNSVQGSTIPLSKGTHVNNEVELKAKEYSTDAVIAGIGDILLHNTVYEDAASKNGYEFVGMFDEVRQLLEEPDFLIANQESVPGGKELGLSSYPLFNSPHEIVSSLQEVGVDAVTTANNHSLDQGEKGVLSAIEYYEKINMPYTGAFKSKQDQQNIRTFNVNGISFALLSYTYGTNGIPVPQGKEYLVNLLEVDQMIADIKKARKLPVDMVVMGLHWGNEYERYPTEHQKSIAKQLTEAGADLIFGHHPHVLQPIEKYKTSDGREAVVIYSLGNFLSGQKDDFKDIGGIASVTVQKKIDSEGVKISFPSIDFHPTYVSENSYQDYKIYPLENAHEQGLVTYSKAEMVSHMKAPLQ
ncbi:CapA family protein [Rossellomorea sp. BNER]|uniref:CapA family protein n=1 Tax=Rossellomorea sp. BNER TaxID=2962031 RepID=UPI003AF1EA88|nr:CapA family protein [Rossellomorea sp. BNER]